MVATRLATALGAALCGLAASAASAATLLPHVPVVMWSPRAMFPASNAYLSATLDEAAVASTLQRVVARDMTGDVEGVLSHSEVLFPKAEVLCLFLTPSLGSDKLAQFAAVNGEPSFVQTAVQTAKSSVVIPRTTRANPLLNELSQLQPHVVNAESLDDFLGSTKGQTLLSNGETDLLVVQLSGSESLPEVDARIQYAANALTAASGGLTDFALTGDAADTTELANPIVRRLADQASSSEDEEEEEVSDAIVCEAGYLIGYSAAGKAFCFSHYVNMTPEILTGLLVGLFFLFLLYIGLGMLNGIQTPTKYPLHGPPHGKEF